MGNNNAQPLYKYIEIKRRLDEEVVKRLDVSTLTEKSAERIEMGMNINLNHNEYYTSSFESEIKLEIID